MPQAAGGPSGNLLIQFTYLQALDLLTTLAFLANGIEEGNPAVRLVLCLAPSPLEGLLGLKALALALGLYCWQKGRRRLLARMNMLFAAVVVWNLIALVLWGSTSVLPPGFHPAFTPTPKFRPPTGLPDFIHGLLNQPASILWVG